MKAEKILIDSYYTTRDGVTVRVASRNIDGSWNVWEQDSQESYRVKSRDLVSPVPDVW